MSVLAPLTALLVACIVFGAVFASYVLVQLAWPRAATYPFWVRSALALVVFGLTGYGVFFVALASPDAFFVLKVAYLVALPAVLISGAIKGCYGSLEVSLTLGLVLLAVLYVALLFSIAPAGDPLAIAASRFSHELPMDNRLPKILTDQVLGGELRIPMAGDWHASDRPPLQAGLYMLVRTAPSAFVYQVVGMYLQILALPGLAILLAATGGLTTRVFVLTILAAAISPVFLVNTVFVWPKLLAAAYALVATAFVVGYFRGDVEKRLASIGIGLSAALSFVAHGGTAFFLLGMGFAAVLVLRTPLLVWIGAAVSFFAVYVPWFIFQNFVDPPGDRHLKWVFAGYHPPTDRSFFDVLQEAYANLTFDAWVQTRVANLNKLGTGVVDHSKRLLDVTVPWGERTSEVLGQIRATEFFELLPSQQFLLWVGGFALVVLLLGRVIWRRELIFLIATLFFAVAIWVMLMFDPGSTVNHQGALAVNLLLTTLLAVAVGSLDWRLLAALVVLTATLNVCLYVLKDASVEHVSWLWFGVAVICVVLLAKAIYGRIHRTAA